MEITDELIDKLFENKHFQEKLNDYVAENLRITQNYDAWEGKYDESSFSFAGKPIEVESKSYGI